MSPTGVSPVAALRCLHVLNFRTPKMNIPPSVGLHATRLRQDSAALMSLLSPFYNSVFPASQCKTRATAL